MLQNEEALDVLFKVCRTGMQWREVQATVSYATVFRIAQMWTKNNIISMAYSDVLSVYKRHNPIKHYCIDSSYVKNRFGAKAHVGKNHTDRGRKAIKLSVITDNKGVVHGMATDPGNRPDVCLFRSTLGGIMAELERLEMFADRGYDSRNKRAACSEFGLKDRIFRRKTKTVRRATAQSVAACRLVARGAAAEGHGSQVALVAKPSRGRTHT